MTTSDPCITAAAHITLTTEKNPFRLKSGSLQGFSSSSSASFSRSAAIQGNQTSCFQLKYWKSEESHTGNHFNLYDNLRLSSGIWCASPVQWLQSVNLHDTVEAMYICCSNLIREALQRINDDSKIIKNLVSFLFLMHTGTILWDSVNKSRKF